MALRDLLPESLHIPSKMGKEVCRRKEKQRPVEKCSQGSWILISPYIFDQPVSKDANIITFAPWAFSLEKARRKKVTKNGKHGKSNLKTDFRVTFFS